MILASFKYNNKEYIYIVNGNNVEYGYKTNDGVCKNLNKEEITLMNTIYKNIMISKDKTNHKKCGIVNHNNKKFQIMYDKISGNKFFYEIIDNSLKPPTYEDFLYLDSMLNPTSMYSSKYEPERLTENNNGSPTNFKNNIKILVTNALAISLSISCLYNVLYINFGPFNNPYLDLPETIIPITEQYQESPNKTIALENLKKAIESNQHLDDIEKQIFLSNLTIIEENFDYINIPEIEKRLNNVYVNYNPYDHEDCIANYQGKPIIPGLISNCPINFFSDSCKSNEDFIEKYGIEYYKEVLTHETCHLLSVDDAFFGYGYIGYKISEGMTEIIACEYSKYDLTTKDKAYEKERIATYMLIELLGVDTVKQFYFSNDSQILINALKEIIDDEDKAYELIGEVDNLEIKFKEGIEKEMYQCDNFDYTFESFNKLFNEYFYQKYGYDMMEDRIIESYIIMQRGSNRLKCSPYKDLTHLQFKDLEHKGLNKFKYDYYIEYELNITPIVYFSQERIHEMYPDGKPKITIEDTYGFGTYDENGNSHDIDYQNTVSIDIESIRQTNNKTK